MKNTNIELFQKNPMAVLNDLMKTDNTLSRSIPRHDIMAQFILDDMEVQQKFVEFLEESVELQLDEGNDFVAEEMNQLLDEFGGMLEQQKELQQKVYDYISSTETVSRNSNLHDAWVMSSSQAEILIRSIAASEFKDEIIKLVKEDMKMDEDHDFAEFDEQTYTDLINKLTTYWDFLLKEND